MPSQEMMWNKLNAIHDEVHTNSIDIAIVKTQLTNHLAHVDKKTNAKFIYLGVGMATFVGLMAIFI